MLLASSAAKGDENAFAELYSLLSTRVFNLVLRSVRDRSLAEDLCQEVWLKAHREIRGLRAPEAFRSWIYRIASHACVDFARSSHGKHRGEEGAIDELIVSYVPEPEDSAILHSEVRMVWETLGSMSPRQSTALYLRQVDGLSYDEIAEVLGCSRPTVEALLFRARQSFTRAFSRVESSAAERCELFSQVMAAVIDNQPTPLQRGALESHASDCPSCRAQLAETRRANRAYLALPLLPIGKGLALEVILAGGSAAAGGGLFAAAAGILGSSALPAKVALLAVLVAGTGAVVTGEITLPAVSESTTIHENADGPTTPRVTTIDAAGATATAQAASGVAAPLTAGTYDGVEAAATPSAPPASAGRADATARPDATATIPAKSSQAAPDGHATGTDDAAEQSSANAPQGSGTAAPPAGPLEEATDTLPDLTEGGSGNVVGTLNDAVNQLPPAVGDAAGNLAGAVATTIDPVDQTVEDLTGISIGETLDDVTNALPSSNATAVPLDQTLNDVLDPVQNLLEDPLAPVDNLLGPLLPTPAPSPQPTATSPSAPSPTVAPSSPDDGPCLLGLLLC